MKKIMFGFFLGIIVAASCNVFAGNNMVSAYLFPSKVTIHNEGITKELNVGGDPILNYNGRTYVPLKAFSGAMSAYVTYKPASESVDNLNKIDLYVVNENDFPIRDSEGYVSFNISKIEKISRADNANYLKISGLIRINKALEGKSVYLTAEDTRGGTVPGHESFLTCIDNELNVLLAANDIRSVAFCISDGADINTLEIKVKDSWIGPNEYAGSVMMLESELALVKSGFDPDLILDKSISKDQYLDDFSVLLYNQTSETMIVEPIRMRFQVIRIDGSQEESVVEFDLPKSTLIIPPSTYYMINIPAWDFKDSRGNIVPEGKYRTQLKVSEFFEYKLVDSKTTNKIESENSSFNHSMLIRLEK